MLVNISFGDEDEIIKFADIIDVPQEIISNIDQIKDKFLNWMFDKANDHTYWVLEDGLKKYCSYSTEAFIYWLNHYFLKDNEAKIIIVSTEQIDFTLPVIYF